MGYSQEVDFLSRLSAGGGKASLREWIEY